MARKRKLGMAKDVRKAMLRGMVTHFLEKGKMKTTYKRAKEVSKQVEKLITIGKVNSLAAKRRVFSYVTKEDVTKKLFDEISPKYKEKNGGYISIVKLGPRRGDAAEMAILKFKEMGWSFCFSSFFI